MKRKVRQSQVRLFRRASESVTRSDRREHELEFASPFPPLTARLNRRRDNVKGWPAERRPSGAPNPRKNRAENLTPVGHLFMTLLERRFAPKTVRQDRNGVRQRLEHVSDSVGIRTHFSFLFSAFNFSHCLSLFC